MVEAGRSRVGIGQPQGHVMWALRVCRSTTLLRSCFTRKVTPIILPTPQPLNPSCIHNPSGSHLQSRLAHSCCQGVASIGAAVLSPTDRQHDLIPRQHSRHGVHPTRQGLAQHQDIGLDSIPVLAHEFAGATQPCLNLIGDQQGVVGAQELLRLCQVIVRGNDNTRLTLWVYEREGEGAGSGGVAMGDQSTGRHAEEAYVRVWM